MTRDQFRDQSYAMMAAAIVGHVIGDNLVVKGGQGYLKLHDLSIHRDKASPGAVAIHKQLEYAWAFAEWAADLRARKLSESGAGVGEGFKADE